MFSSLFLTGMRDKASPQGHRKKIKKDTATDITHLQKRKSHTLTLIHVYMYTIHFRKYWNTIQTALHIKDHME